MTQMPDMTKPEALQQQTAVILLLQALLVAARRPAWP